MSTEERLLVRKDLMFSNDIFLFVLRLDLFSALLEEWSILLEELLSSFLREEVIDLIEREVLRLIKDVDLEIDFFFSCWFSVLIVVGMFPLSMSLSVVIPFMVNVECLSLFLEDLFAVFLKDFPFFCKTGDPIAFSFVERFN